jgi:hypothetical protein
MAAFASYVPVPSIDCVPLYTSHEFRSPRGGLLGGVLVYPSALQPGWVRYEVLRMVCRVLKDIAEGEAPNEAEAVRVARFLVER